MKGDIFTTSLETYHRSVNLQGNMPQTITNIQIDRAVSLERELSAERQRIAAALRARRVELGLSITTVAPKAKLSIASLSYIERGEQWETGTIQRLVRFYDKTAA